MRHRGQRLFVKRAASDLKPERQAFGGKPVNSEPTGDDSESSVKILKMSTFPDYRGAATYSHLQEFGVVRAKTLCFPTRMSFAVFPHPRVVIHFRVERSFMRPKPVPMPARRKADMFCRWLDNMIDIRHKLEFLAGLIDRERFDESMGGRYAEKGRPGLPTRLMFGLHLPSEKITPYIGRR
jgi:hypothetical protein